MFLILLSSCVVICIFLDVCDARRKELTQEALLGKGGATVFYLVGFFFNAAAQY